MIFCVILTSYGECGETNETTLQHICHTESHTLPQRVQHLQHVLSSEVITLHGKKT